MDPTEAARTLGRISTPRKAAAARANGARSKGRPKSDRRERAMAAYRRVFDMMPGAGMRQAIDAWLALATPGEVRRYWKRWMGRLPGWAEKP